MSSVAIIDAANTTTIQFYGQPIITAMVAGIAYVAMKPIVENLGMSWTTQYRKLISSGTKYEYAHMSMPSKGGIQEMLCFPLRKLNGWLFSINPGKVRADIRDKLIRYQEECFSVLHGHWTKGEARKKTSTITDDRTPLRDAISMLTAKHGVIYPEACSFIHQRFGVTHIDELEQEQLPQAVEYIHKLVLTGEYIGKEQALPVLHIDLSLEVNNIRVAHNHLKKLTEIWQHTISPALRMLNSPLTSEFRGRLWDASGMIFSAKASIERKAGH